MKTQPFQSENFSLLDYAAFDRLRESATKAVFLLTDEGLAFAHNGKWFSIDKFRSLAEGWSDKDPQQCIGHTGLGFKSRPPPLDNPMKSNKIKNPLEIAGFLLSGHFFGHSGPDSCTIDTLLHGTDSSFLGRQWPRWASARSNGAS